jgi:hypothetical protein
VGTFSPHPSPIPLHGHSHAPAEKSSHRNSAHQQRPPGHAAHRAGGRDRRGVGIPARYVGKAFRFQVVDEVAAASTCLQDTRLPTLVIVFAAIILTESGSGVNFTPTQAIAGKVIVAGQWGNAPRPGFLLLSRLPGPMIPLGRPGGGEREQVESTAPLW